MNRILSVIIPIAPHHEDIAQQAYASVMAQNIPCEIIPIKDRDMRGAGWTRNQGLAKASCDFVTFLDADDILDPSFAEVTLGILEQYAQSHEDVRYAYTDWYGLNNAVIQAPEPCIAWTEKTFHVVTAVVPTNRARLIGGFDEVMQGVEDADFYLRLRLSGVCGLHINAPLMSYREGGQRSVQARANGSEAQAQMYMSNRYGGYNLMGCCGDNTQTPITPGNEPQEGFILAQAQWQGNRVQRGFASGQLYPRTSWPNLMYIDPRDAEVSPTLWKRVTSPQAMSNGVVLQPQYKPVQNWQDVVQAVYGGGSQPVQAPSQPVEYKPNVSGRKKADIVAQAQQWTKTEGSDL